jgi:hypothetical protein
MRVFRFSDATVVVTVELGFIQRLYPFWRLAVHRVSADRKRYTAFMSESRRLTSDLRNLLPGPFFCAECAERLCSAAAREPGVTDVSCNLERGTLDVHYDARLMPEALLADRLRALAAAASERAGHAAYRLSGLD